MKRSRTLIKTLLVLGPMAVALSALAPNSSYAYAAVDPVYSPYCPYPYDSLSCNGWDGGWWGGDWRHDYHGFDHRGVGRGGFGHGGFGHGGLGGHGGFGGGGHGGGGHGR